MRKVLATAVVALLIAPLSASAYAPGPIVNGCQLVPAPSWEHKLPPQTIVCGTEGHVAAISAIAEEAL